MPEQQKKANAVGLYLKAIAEGNPRLAAQSFLGDQYRQHSTGVRDGVEGFISFVDEFTQRNPEREIRIVRALEDGPHVFLHVYQRLNGAVEWVTTDFFLTDEFDRIIEHWDVIAPYSGTTPSGHTSIDGSQVIEDEHLTESNKAIVAEMLREVLIEGGNPACVGEWIAEEYVQHNAEVPDGLEPFRRLAVAPDKPLKYDEIVLLVGEGNFVATLCRAQWENTPYAQVDLFRLAGGKIVEHWDCAEPVSPQPVNSGKF